MSKLNFLEKYAVDGQHYERKKKYDEILSNPNSNMEDLNHIARSLHSTEQQHEKLITHPAMLADDTGARWVARYSTHKNILDKLADHSNYEVKSAVARNSHAHEDTLLKMATRHEPDMDGYIKSDLLGNRNITQKITHAGMEHSLKNWNGDSAKISQFAYFAEHKMTDPEFAKKKVREMDDTQRGILKNWHSQIHKKLTD